MSEQQRVLLVSILSLGRQQNVLDQLASLPAWLDAFSQETGIVSHIVIRNNDPGVSFAATAARLLAVQAEFPALRCSLITDVPNSGFGGGHNANVAVAPSDYVLILNDDIGFPHIAWLNEAVQVMRLDPRTVCVGAEENPKYINPAFGNGLMPGAFHLHTISYAEASILLFDRAAYDKLGGFAPDYRWAMCEDSDLSLRVQQFGWRIGHVSMPHQHWRSMSFNALPGSVKTSILEHNRAALFANWRDTLTAGVVGSYEVFDIWSDGMGDVFCALPHLLARLAALSPARRAHVVVNTSHPELFAWLRLEGVRVTSVSDLAQLRTDLAADGIATVRSMRDINFSLPMNIHALLAGALGIDAAGAACMADFARAIRRLPLPAEKLRLRAGSYCVLHLEFDRNHEGRALPPSGAAQLLRLCAALFKRVVLVGRERRLSAALCAENDSEIIDLQGQLSLSQLAAVISHAQAFVGIDSFPAHIAQATRVPAAIVFGTVHPLSRTWNDNTVWPLTASLDCIGCYHTHIEPSVPFCMRRDEACMTGLDMVALRGVLSAMVSGHPHDWAAARLRWHDLQARLIKLLRYHPAPPERLFRGQLASNEQISNLVYRMTNQMGDLLRGHYHSNTVGALSAQVQDLRAELFAARVQIDQARQGSAVRPAQTEAAAPALPQTSRILQISTLKLMPQRCQLAETAQWIDAVAIGDDPQIMLPPLKGGGGKVQLRLSCIGTPQDALQIYWSIEDAAFTPENVHTLPLSEAIQTANLVFDLAEGELLSLRIDPTTDIGQCRLRGSLSGQFVILDHAEPVLRQADQAAVPERQPKPDMPGIAETLVPQPDQHAASRPLAAQS